MKPKNRLKLIPFENTGTSLYNGQPSPTIKIMEELGIEGVNYISSKIKKMVKMRMEMHGKWNKEAYGLPDKIRFFDMETGVEIIASEFTVKADSESPLYLAFTGHDEVAHLIKDYAIYGDEKHGNFAITYTKPLPLPDARGKYKNLYKKILSDIKESKKA